MKILWRERALCDVEAIRDHIGQDNSFYATVFVQKVIEQVERLEEFPMIGRVVPEYSNESIRELLYRDYRIIYEIFDGEIYIITVIHGARRLDS